jgi:hypothetical protein
VIQGQHEAVGELEEQEIAGLKLATIYKEKGENVVYLPFSYFLSIWAHIISSKQLKQGSLFF